MSSEFKPIRLNGEASSSAQPWDSISRQSEGDGDGLHLFLSHPRAIELPKSGCITFKFARGPVTVTEAYRDRPGSATVDLTLIEICEVEEHSDSETEEASEEISEHLEGDDLIDRLFDEARESESEVENEQDEEESE